MLKETTFHQTAQYTSSKIIKLNINYYFLQQHHQELFYLGIKFGFSQIIRPLVKLINHLSTITWLN